MRKRTEKGAEGKGSRKLGKKILPEINMTIRHSEEEPIKKVHS